MKEPNKLRELEKMAALEHERWSRWYLWEKQNWSLENEARWDRQANTPYEELSEKEKESDRREVRPYFELLKEDHQRLVEAAEKIRQRYLALLKKPRTSKEATYSLEGRVEGLNEVINLIEEK